MTRESEARASVAAALYTNARRGARRNEHRRIAPKSAFAEIFIEISFHPSYCKSASSQLVINHFEIVN